MYCSPATSKVLGAAMIPDCANIDHNFSPLSARYTLKFPAASPCTTMLPAVVTTPPFHGPLYATRQASRCSTGFQASRNPSFCEVSDEGATPKFQPMGAMGRLGSG